MEVSGQLHAQAALALGKEPRYPLDRRMVYTVYMSKINIHKNISYMTRGFFKHLVLVLWLVTITT
jgi:hypothetical protein